METDQTPISRLEASMKTRVTWVVTVLLMAGGLATAQEKDAWIGRRVVTQSTTALKVGVQVVDDPGRNAKFATSEIDRARCRVYRVEQTDGEWLRLKDEKSGVTRASISW